jgi:hypothetical protein
MLIRVMYDNGKFDMVKPQLLGNLLEIKRVARFKRSENWAVVGRDPIRSNHQSQNYKGPERRTC